MRTTTETDRSLFNSAIAPTIEVKQSTNPVKDNTLLMKLTISGMSFEKKVASSTVIDESIDPRLMRVTKSTIAKEYLTTINSLDSEIRKNITSLGFRPSFIHSGFVLIPVTAIDRVESALDIYYTVICREDERGYKTVECTCKGAEKGLVCYHAASALSLHIGLAKQRQTATA